MNAADKKQAVIYGVMGAAVAALHYFAPSVLAGLVQGVVSWVLFVFVGPFLWGLYFSFYCFGGVIGRNSFIEFLGCLSAFLFWFFILPRLLCRWGIYNPFRRLDAPRPFFFRAVVAFSDWWNKTLHFGRHKTGGWGA